MKQIALFFPRYLHNSEHDQLHTDIENQISAETPEKLGISDLYASYKDARTAEKAALQANQGSIYTKSITEADAYRDDLDYGFELLIKSHLHHFDPEVQQKAARVWRIIEQYGNIRRVGYSTESSDMANRNAEIINKHATDLSAIGSGLATQWLGKLEEANNQFQAHFGDRATESLASIDGNVLDARLAVDKAFDDISTRVNALVVVNGEENYAAFIGKVNYFINYHKETLAARKGRKKSGETEEIK